VFFARRYSSPVSLFDCGNKVLQQASSPDGKYVATLFERSCGATTPFYRMVALHSAGTDFRMDTADNSAFSLQGQPDVKLQWEDTHRLVLVSYQCDDTSLRQKIWGDVKIACATRK
jgi:hypothetical protein